MKKMLFMILPLLSACQSNDAVEGVEVKVPNQTLIVSSAGTLANINLNTNSISWQYTSKHSTDQSGNRNHFVWDAYSLYLPFESGMLMAFDIISGERRWVNLPADEHGMSFGGEDEDGEAVFESTGIYYMSAPLLSGGKLYISSVEAYGAKFMSVDTANGALSVGGQLSTQFNLFSPVLCKGHLFVNSAVFLDVSNESGHGTQRYATFPAPLYAQMQSNGKKLFVGDETGVFYALNFDPDAGLGKYSDCADVTHPEAAPDLFNWRFQSESYPSLGDGLTALVGRTLIITARRSSGDECALIGIDTKSGKQKWIYEAYSPITNWSVCGHEIIGYTNMNDEEEGTSSCSIFVLNLKGKVKEPGITMFGDLLPVSNIVRSKHGDLLYLTEKGVTQLGDGETELIVPFKHSHSAHNIAQIQYFGQ